jgi:hypothetical protein
MLVGLGDFRIINQLAELPEEVEKQLQASGRDLVNRTLEVGKQIALARKNTGDPLEIAQMLLAQFGLHKGKPHEKI